MHVDARPGDHEEQRPAGIVNAGEGIRRNVQNEAAAGEIGAPFLYFVVLQIVGLPDSGDVTASRREPEHMVK